MSSYPEDHVIEERGAILRAREVAILTERERNARQVESMIHDFADKKVREALRKAVEKIRSGPPAREIARNARTASVFESTR